MLHTALEAGNQVVKWLYVPVNAYLEAGLPVMDYTQDGRDFIKTKQGDIDVGQHFNKCHCHLVDQHTL